MSDDIDSSTGIDSRSRLSPTRRVIRWLSDRPRILWFALLAICLFSNTITLLKYTDQRPQPYIWGLDNNGYFAWGRSLALDGDIDFRNDFEFIASLEGGGSTQESFAAYLATLQPTPTGKVPNKYGIGFGLLALPSLLLARGSAEIYAAVTGTQVSEFAAVYPFAFIVTSILLGFAGLALSFRLLRRWYSKAVSLAAIAVGMAALSIGYYIWFEPTMAHSATFAMMTLFIASAIRWQEAVARNNSRYPVALAASLLGLAFGFACTVRYTCLVAITVPLILLLENYLRRDPARPKPSTRAVFLSVFLFLATAVIGFLPQMVAWKVLYGHWMTNSYQGEEMYPWPRHGVDVLFSLRNGLFTWTPLALIALAGLVATAVRGSGLAVAGLAVMAGATWVYGSWHCWWLGHSYGMRGFADFSFFFFLGLAEVFRRAAAFPRRTARTAFAAIIACLVIWNLFFIECYRADLQPHGERFAGASLFKDMNKWRKQAGKDYRLLKRLREPLFPLFTPVVE